MTCSRTTDLADNGFEVRGTSAFCFLVPAFLFAEMLINLEIAEDGGLRFDDLHGD